MLTASLSSVGWVAFASANPLYAAQLALTPPQTRGPFYPVELPLDSDNDLVLVQGRSEFARGEITNLVGRVLDELGRPVEGARVEIWQCDANGRYHHPGDRRSPAIDANFQGFGAFTTGPDGAYRFRTIKPVTYPGRAPHIHFSIKGVGVGPLVTQMYLAGAPENQWDGLLNRIRDPRSREQVIVQLEANPDQSAKLLAKFDIVLAQDGRLGDA